MAVRDGQAVITAAGKKVTAPSDTMSALERLLSGCPANVKDVTAATGIDAAALADVLLEHGICAEVTPDLARGYAGMMIA